MMKFSAPTCYICGKVNPYPLSVPHYFCGDHSQREIDDWSSQPEKLERKDRPAHAGKPARHS